MSCCWRIPRYCYSRTSSSNSVITVRSSGSRSMQVWHEPFRVKQVRELAEVQVALQRKRLDVRRHPAFRRLHDELEVVTHALDNLRPAYQPMPWDDALRRQGFDEVQRIEPATDRSLKMMSPVNSSLRSGIHATISFVVCAGPTKISCTSTASI
jgi:hypothetical protein